MSTSPALIERNRLNAQRSTGPKTPEGKARASQNARKDGLFLGDVTLEHENPEEMADLYAGYVADYRPDPGIETELVRQLAVATLRLRRLERIENAAMFSDAPARTRHEANVVIEQTFIDQWDRIEKILRARTAAERSFHRIYKELEARRKSRRTPRPAPAAVEIESDTRHTPIPTTQRPRPLASFCKERQLGSNWPLATDHWPLRSPVSPQTGTASS